MTKKKYLLLYLAKVFQDITSAKQLDYVMSNKSPFTKPNKKRSVGTVNAVNS